jgi:hypothetical protein
MQNLIEGEKDVAWNLQKVDAVLKSKSGGNDHIVLCQSISVGEQKFYI